MFHGLFSTPSFSGYLEGHTLTKAIAYGVAADFGNELSQVERNRKYAAKYERNLVLRRNLMLAGILPGLKPEPKIPTATRLHLPREAPKPKRVITPHSPVVSKYQSYSPAVSSTGGLRGSKATRRRR